MGTIMLAGHVTSSRAAVAALTLLLATQLSACAMFRPAEESQPPATATYLQENRIDPLEPMNRGIFAFNEVVDALLLKPAMHAYRFVLPEPARRKVTNVLTNLGEPINFGNAVLQGDVRQAFTTFWRFTLNSTVGVLGLFDIAGTYGNLPYRNEDFGQTLGVYGMGTGPYLVLPILGPSSLRDTAGLVVDGYADPLRHVTSDEVMIAERVVRGIDTRDRLDATIQDVYRDSLDPYATFRSAYFQRRAAAVANRTDARLRMMPDANAAMGGGMPQGASALPAAQTPVAGQP